MRRILWFGMALALVGCPGDPDPVVTLDAQSEPDIQAAPDVGTTDATPEEDATSDDTGLDEGPCAGLDDGASCDDEDACTEATTCSAGLCGGGSTIACDESDPCTVCSCDPAKGVQYTPKADGEACTLGCFDAATCESGACVGTEGSQVVCPDSTEPCVAALICDPGTGACTAPAYMPPGAPCESNGDVCALEECDGMGACKATGEVEACSTQSLNNPCWTWQCNKKSGCQQVAFLEGVSCDDGNGCTISDTCDATDQGGKLCIGTPLDVDDGNPCTDDKCVGGAVDHVALSGSVCGADCDLALCDAGECTCQDGPPPTGTPCNGTGWHYCTTTCGEDSLPMAQCVAGKLADCSCHDFGYTQVDAEGTVGIGSSMAGIGDDLWLCYKTGKQLTVATNVSGSWAHATHGNAGECALYADQGTVHIAYGKHVESNHPRINHATLNGTQVSATIEIEPGAARNGYDPSVAVRGGTVHITSAEIIGSNDYALRYFTRPPGGAWTAETVTALPETTFGQSIAVCDNGVPFISYLEYSSDWTARVAARSGGSWATALLDDSSDKIGPAPVARCQDGRATTVYADFSGKTLRLASSGNPPPLDGFSKSTLPMESVGFHSDLVIHDDHYWVVFFYQSGAIGLAVRPLDLKTDWQVHRVASQEMWDVGAITGNVKLHIDDTGKPHIMFFGAFGRTDGPWIAALTE